MDETERLRRLVADLKGEIELLRGREAHYRSIFENIQDIYYECAIDGTILEISPSVEKISGYRPEDLLGRSVEELYLVKGARAEFLRRIRETGKVEDYELVLRAKDGRPLFLSVNVRLVADEAGVPRKIVGSMRDITRRKEAEEALLKARRDLERAVAERTAELREINRLLAEESGRHREAEEKYRAILEGMQEGYYEVDLAGNFTFFNPALTRILGYAPEELLGMNNRRYSDPETAKKVFRAYNEVYRSGVPMRNLEWELIRKDGRRVWVETSVSLIRDAATGEPVGFRGLMLDITQRKEAQIALLESQRRLMDIIAFLPDATMVVDEEGRVIAWNRAMEALTGVPAAEILGRGDYAYALPFYKKRRPLLVDLALRADPKLDALYPNVVREGHVVSGEARLRHFRGGDRIIWGMASALLDQEGRIRGAIETIRDITDRKAMEEEIRNLAITDPLTGLLNRRGFFTLVEHQMRLARRSGKGLLLVYMDLDGLKGINDTLGHEEGDRAIRETAQVLREVFRASDIAARLGGDEFAVLVVDTARESETAVARRLDDCLIARNGHPERRYALSISAGMVPFDAKAHPTLDDWLRAADERMYRQKEKKRKKTGSPRGV
ncbi:MAG TPA: PAS domain S-box protein [Syntrophales bacterium]|nr:PAS domain S-box protein [Syntrophales bacterium]HOM06518.1 PAS domain S-box protein [Syntrophales bacterium]HON99903.1 PAS domain S-box protein [Syntrophales bacterium]HPQ06220.1 PAS domain S-box protein [Syntrophales bacterium]HRS86320.1 PAS domain S-box protein [Syntrophales bacterium]